MTNTNPLIRVMAMATGRTLDKALTPELGRCSTREDELLISMLTPATTGIETKKSKNKKQSAINLVLINCFLYWILGVGKLRMSSAKERGIIN